VPETNQDAAYTHYYTGALAGAEEKDFVIRIKGTCTTDGTFSDIRGKFGMGYWSVGNPTGVNASDITGFLRWGHKNKIVKAAGNISALTEGSTVKNYAYHSAFSDCRGLEDISGLVFTDSGNQGLNFLYGAFKECTALTTIPAGLLPRGLTNTRYFLYRTFQGSGIETIPSGFLPEFTAVDVGFLSEAFGGVNSGDGTAISAIPPDFIPRSLTTVGNSFLQNTFANCVNLTTIPDGFTANITSVGNGFLDSTFSNCTGLRAIPANFVPQNPTTIGTYFLKNTFGRTGIETIPADFIPAAYKTATTGTDFLNGTFSSCLNLTTVNLAFLNNAKFSSDTFCMYLLQGGDNLSVVHIPYINTDNTATLAGLVSISTAQAQVPGFVRPITVYITGGGTSDVLVVYQSAGLRDVDVLAVYLDNAELVNAYRGSSFWSAIDDSKFQVRPQE
jgi:hypothetical protein